jgi:hypothetical protein
MRTDAIRWIRPDAYRFMPPGSPHYIGTDVVRYFWPDDPLASPAQVESKQDVSLDALIATQRKLLQQLRSEVAVLEAEFKFRRFLRNLKYSPDQPRVPAGNPDGGQWTADEQSTDEESEPDTIQLAQSKDAITDADGNPYYQPGGHHEMAKGVYDKWNLQPETRQVFDQATTGRLPPMILRNSSDGVPMGNFWNGPNGAHGIYNEAVGELGDQFLEQNGIKPEEMTPDQARDLLKEIRESQDPRIRDFNSAIRLLRRLFPLRGGRGNE